MSCLRCQGSGCKLPGVACCVLRGGYTEHAPRKTHLVPAMCMTNASPHLAGAGTNALRDIKPPVEIPSGWAWLGWVLAAIILGALLWWAWSYWPKRRAVIPPV